MLRVVAIAICVLGGAIPPDLIPPGHRSARHELLIATDDVSRDLRLWMAPVHGFGSSTRVKPSRAYRFSTKYGSRLWILGPDEEPPARLEDGWDETHRSIEIPFHEIASVPAGSPVTRILTLCRIRPDAQGTLQLHPLAEIQFGADGQPLATGFIWPWMIGISLLGLLGLVARAGYERRSGW